ncbi:hypothetical protein [Thermoflavifilum thermophilum]|uniref:Long-chain fatty acid transport protein n=1 Tax=Thermoflavifilum thermophilum TaxID=1393122 RepID=A0A1I7NDS3_9BACT|nr:hypothetical protein [Thermoflavifilum thermophilum]SFV32824.1 hypothetical protein SAMN05660895_1468 [Thermoflavifilum thermophilum]
MMMRSILAVICIAGICCMQVSALHAQVRPNFPYSSLGIGEINYNTEGMLSGLGNATSAVRSDQYPNNANVASFSGMQRQLAVLEAGATGISATFKDNNTTANASYFSIDRFDMAFKFNNWWGSGFGLKPLSTVRYQILQTQTYNGGTQSISTTIQGTGGLNEVYWGNGFKIGNHFSAGVKLSYIFGNITRSEIAGYDVNTPLLTSSEQDYYQNFHVSYAAQIFGKLGSNWDYVLAGTYAPHQYLHAQSQVTVVSGIDTLSFSNAPISDFRLPDQYRGGLAFTYQHSLSFILDYAYEKWGDASTNVNAVQTVNSTRYGAGIKYEPEQNYSIYSRDWLHRIVAMGAFNYTKSYLQINNQQLRDINVSLGLGIYNAPHTLNLNLGLEIGQQGGPGTSSTLITENYVRLHMGIILRDIWFVKRKFY